MSKTKNQTQMIAVCGVLSALTIVVSFLPLRTMGLEITLSMVPVAIAAACFGRSAGAVLGGVFGLVSFLQCFGYSAFGAVLLSLSPWRTLLVCLPTRVLAGLLAAVIAKGFKNQRMSLLAGAVCAPILNTLFFMSTLCICFYGTEYIQGFVSALGAANPVSFVLLFVGINGLVEIVAGAAIAYPASIAVKKVIR